jgi:hypothetical protein
VNITILYLLISSLILPSKISFNENNSNYEINLNKKSNYYELKLSENNNEKYELKDRICFKDSVYQFCVIDINSDGKKDYLIGFYKTTRWHKKPSPTIHIYSYFNDKFVPIWRASHIGNNLIYFEVDSSDTKPCVKLLEEPDKGSFNVVLYKWDSFGLKFYKYIEENIDYNTSKKYFRSLK